MKTTNFFYRISVGVICGSALALSACNDELTNTVDNEPVAANVTAQICTETRASGTSWTNNDAIGISSIGQTSACTNVKYVTANGDGIFTGTPIYFQDAQSSVTFSAYYPFSGSEGTGAGILANSTQSDNQSAENQPNIDYLWATATANKEHPTVNFIFSHQMSKLTLVFQNGIDTEVSGITTYTLKGLKMEGTFDTGTGKAIAKEDANTENLTVATSGVISGSALPSLILYPQVITDKLELSIMNGGKSYSCDLTVTNNALANGKDYQYTITLTKEQLKVTSSSIEPWNTEKHSGTATIE